MCVAWVYMAWPPPLMQVMDDLIKGQEFATQLQGLLRDNPKVGLLMDQILQSFSRAIDAAKAGAGEWSSDVQSEVTYGGSGGGKRKSGAGGDSSRGACRRRTQQSSVVTKTMNTLDDGQAWRKYGQKYIHNSKHPRAYFRCTHKYDQQCAAQRQVQRCEDDDDDKDTFRVTYIGVHTCRDPAAAPVHVTRTAGCHLISFGPTPTTTTSTTTTAQVGSGLQSLKRESGGDQEEVLSSSTPAATPPAPAWPDLGDVTSAPHCCYAGVDFLEDYTQGLEYILPFDLDG